MNCWVFKINTRRGWEFARYFRSRARGVYPLGDQGWIRSASSLRFLRDEVKRGDLFLCYEVDRKLLVGVACAASDGRDRGQGSLLDFCPPREAIHLRNPLCRRPDLDHILAFTPARGRGTIQEIDVDELARLRRIILRKNPEQASQLERILGSRSSREGTAFPQRTTNRGRDSSRRRTVT
ncbi:MAG TPA: hypothetical protein VI455_09490 [Terriglobia bacterium]